MNPTQQQKTLSYVVLGIVVVVALGIYIYLTLSNAPSESQTTIVAASSRPGLTPEEASAKQALIASQMAEQKPQPLSTNEANAKAALMKAQLQQN